MDQLNGPKRTKIVCTIGPASNTPETIDQLIEAGMDVARLNFSHGDHESHRATLEMVRAASAKAGRPIGILQDLAGPKIRLGKLDPPERELKAGEEVVLTSGDHQVDEALPVNYQYLAEDVEVGDRILLADGLVEMRVVAEEGERVTARVLVGGMISSQKGVNLPVSSLRVPSFTDKDRKDLAAGLEMGVDFVALSFVRHEDDLDEVADIINSCDDPPLLIAKIEKPQAVERIKEILARVGGVMVARGDLGVEMPLEEVPMVQKRIIALARRAGKPVITATQMLRSMMTSPRPTRAEANDVANAILDGTDAVMLSDETAVGNYPVQAVEIMNRVARATEPSLFSRNFLKETPTGLLPVTEAAISRAACFLAEDVEAAAIVAGTASGGSARLVARFRPPRPVVGFTANPSTCRQLALSWGVLPVLTADYRDTDGLLSDAARWVSEKGVASPGDRLVITAGSPVGQPGTTNLLKVVQL